MAAARRDLAAAKLYVQSERSARARRAGAATAEGDADGRGAAAHSPAAGREEASLSRRGLQDETSPHARSARCPPGGWSIGRGGPSLLTCSDAKSKSSTRWACKRVRGRSSR